MDLIRLEAKIADGLNPPCPNGHALVIDRKEGTSGAVHYLYRCSQDGCDLKPGTAFVPWHAVILKAIQKRAIQLVLTGIGSITLAGVVGFASGLIHIPTGRSEASAVDAQLNRLFQKADNDFERSLFADMRRVYVQATTKNYVEYETSTESVLAMVKAADAATTSLDGIGVFSPDAWDGELAPYVLANQRAVRRNVRVRRIFEIPANASKDLVARFIKTMKRQKVDFGINVFFVFEDQISVLPFFDKHPFVPTGLFDGRYLGFNLVTHSQGRRPERVRITWDKNEVAANNPFGGMFESQHVIPFDPATAEKAINDHLNGEGR